MYLEKMNTLKEGTNGQYSQAVKIGDFVYLSNIIADDVNADIMTQIKEVMKKLEDLLAVNGLAMHHIVKVNIYLTEEDKMVDVDKLYGESFDTQYTLPARTMMAVKALENNAKVAIDAYVIDTLNLEQQMQQQGGCCNGGCHGDCGCDSGCDK